MRMMRMEAQRLQSTVRKNFHGKAEQCEKLKKKIDKAYQKSLSKRAKERIIKRIEAEEPSERQCPREFPEWALVDVQ